MPDNQCRRFLVSGRVQGVFYRATTREQAAALGLTGWVKNLDDGCVELVACGPADVVAKLEQWLYRGPDYARVDEVLVEDMAIQSFTGFQVRY
jgi:acylphosphatase